MSVFPLLDEYLGCLLDADLAALTPARTVVVEPSRRLRREESYGFIHALWWVWLADGRSAVSVPPGAGPAVERIAAGVQDAGALYGPALAAQLTAALNPVLRAHGLAVVDRTRHSLLYGCDGPHLRRHAHGDCRRLIDGSIAPAHDIWFPTHCFPDGIVYGVVADGQVVSVAHAHRSHLMEDRVADLGVETAPAYRRRGYAQTVVSAVVGEMTGRGGEALYSLGPDNLPSLATATSVGFQPYGRALALAAPAPDLAE